MNKLKILYFYIIGFLLLVSCENEKVNYPIFSTDTSAKNYVSKELAIEVANNFLHKISAFKKNENSKSEIDKTVLGTLTFKTMNNDNAFYAVNYNEGGFVVVSADNRVSPIRAYSDNGTFSENLEQIPDPVVTWMEEEKDVVQDLKTKIVVQTAPIQYEWNYLLTVIGNPGICENIFIQKGPLLKTTWGQWTGYNNLIPFSCSNSSGQAPTGCVATAMAQVMKFHQYPTNYNWTNMPNYYGTLDTQFLMRNIGISIGMDYSCNSSGATSSDMPSTFINHFGYSSANYSQNYNPDVVTNQLTANKPVILTGGRKRSGVYFPWNDYTGGHAWVCDGYQLLVLRAPQPNGSCFNWGFRFLHMNWGWDGRYNVWYNDNNFNPNGGDYNYKRGMLFNIIP